MYIYAKERVFWEVGFFLPTGVFEVESQWLRREDAARRVNYLNGGTGYLFVEIEPNISDQLET